MSIRAAGATHLGRRNQNQDRLLLADPFALYAVADGVGGEVGGEIASQLAVQSVHQYFTTMTTPVHQEALIDAFALAERRISRQAVGRLERMATTLVAMRFEHGAVTIAHVGDSRAYIFRNGALVPLTIDHTVAEEWKLAAGGYVPSRGDALTRALASCCNSHPDFHTIKTQPGDVYLLCSDGVSKPLAEYEIGECLCMDDPEAAAQSLVDNAIFHGGRDNATAVVVRIDA